MNATGLVYRPIEKYLVAVTLEPSATLGDVFAVEDMGFERFVINEDHPRMNDTWIREVYNEVTAQNLRGELESLGIATKQTNKYGLIEQEA